MNALSLKSRIVKSPSGQESDTLYCCGWSKLASEDAIRQVLSEIAQPLELDLSSRHRGVLWAKYDSIATAHETALALHQRLFLGMNLSIRFELGVDEAGKPIVARSNHNTVIRQIKHSEADSASPRHANYTSKSLLVGGTEFPFPSGLYLTRLIALTRTVAATDPLLAIITNTTIAKYAKEASEAMAMVDAIERAWKLLLPQRPVHAQVFVLGDGKQPFCAAACCLHLPQWEYHSIDPILEAVDVGGYADRFHQCKMLSQDFIILPSTHIDAINIVIACHSHAPLEEFWHRLPSPKIAVAMPCCADYSILRHSMPLMEFEDFEVYSAKRRISIHADLGGGRG